VGSELINAYRVERGGLRRAEVECVGHEEGA
jgi:hypothetical protein